MSLFNVDNIFDKKSSIINMVLIYKTNIQHIITYANKFPYIILLTSTDQYFSISGV